MTQHLNVDLKEVETLIELEKVSNNGRGMNCVRSIITYIQRGDIGGARNVRTWDGDKTRSYPVIENQLHKMFGCRTHGVFECKNWLCESIHASLLEDLKKKT